jgi:hypothetical protein
MSKVPSSKGDCVWYSHGSMPSDYWLKNICFMCQKCWVILQDILPKEFGHGEFHNTRAYTFRRVKVFKQHKTTTKNTEDRWIGTHKNVYVWYELVNGYAVGMNENPSRGLSFPVVKMPANRRFVNPAQKGKSS